MTDVFGKYTGEPNAHICGRNFDRNCLKCIEDGEKILFRWKMNFEKSRLETFIGWPVPYVDTRSLAKTGFYYTKEVDKVMCNFCGLGLGEWEALDVPLEEHKRFSSQCPLLLGEAPENKPLDKPKKVFKNSFFSLF